MNQPLPQYPQEIILPQLTDSFLRKKTVLEATALTSSSLFHLVRLGRFPRPYKLSERISAWKLSEVQDWMDSRKRSGGDV